MSKGKCPFCQKDAEAIDLQAYVDVKRFSCVRCGKFDASESMRFESKDPEKSKLVSGVLRWRTENGLISKHPLTTHDDILAGADIPITIPDKVDKLLLYLGSKSKRFGDEVSVVCENDYPLIFTSDPWELLEIIRYLRINNITEGYKHETLDANPDNLTRTIRSKLTMEGWNRFYSLQKTLVDTTQCFIAMNFDAAYDLAFLKMSEALDHCGFVAYRVKNVQHNDDITDLIIAGIKKSKFLIADFTGQRPGVYFEAGFARGLGRTVIWTCKESDKENIHFDTDHFAHIFWKDEEDLKKKLIDRIEATI